MKMLIPCCEPFCMKEMNADMTENNNAIRPHDWFEAEKMVDAFLDEGKRDEFNVNKRDEFNANV